MICNPKVKLKELRDSTANEYRMLKRQDQGDPIVQLQLSNNSRVRNILKGNNADTIERELFGLLEDQVDPLTNNFKKALTNSENKVSISINGYPPVKEEVKSVTHINKDGQDYIEVATYPSTKSNSVRTYTFAIGQDLGSAHKIDVKVKGKIRKSEAVIRGIGNYTKYLQDSGKLLPETATKNKEVGNEALKGLKDLLGSNKESINNFKQASNKIDDYVHGNINMMKDTFNKLVDDSSSSYAKYGRELLSGFSPKFFKDMELFIDEVDKDSEGNIGVDRIDIFKSKLPRSDRSQMDAGEVYLHEVIHSMTRFALDEGSTKAKALSRQLSKLVEEARDSIEVSDLYPEGATQTEKDIINKRYEYIFNNSEGPDIGNQEFLAHALTNPALMDKLKTIGIKEEKMPLMDRIVDFFYKITRVLLGELDFSTRDKSLYDRAYNLAYRLGEINVEAEKRQSKLIKASDYVTDLMAIADNAIAEKIQAAKDKVTGDGLFLEKYPKDGTKAEKTAYMMKFVKYGFTTEEGRSLFGAMFTSTGFSLLSPLSSFREFVGSFFERSDTEKVVDWLGLAAGKIDTMRESIVNTSRSLIFEAFDGELKEFEDEALTKYIIDTNLGVIYKEYGLDGIRKFLSSEQETTKEIGRLKGKLRKLDSTNYNWLSAQAHGLGYYMATHITNEAQNQNSYNIANGRMGVNKINYNPEVERLVSEIASLTSLKYIMEEDSEVVVDLIDRKPEGIKDIINMYEGFKTTTRETMFKDDPVHMVEGYSSEQFNENIELKVLPAVEAEKLKSLGFKKVKDLGRTNKEGQELSLYVSEGYGVKERLRGAAKLVSMASKGTSLAETIYGNSLNPELELSVETKLLHKKRQEIAKQMAEGTYDVTKNKGSMMPLLNGEGEVVSYRYVMDKKSKKEFLEQDTRISEVLPRSKGHIVDKIYTLEQNKRVLDFIVEDMEKNFRGMQTGGPKGLTDYTIIKADSPNEDVRELFKMLPKNFKDYANSREDKSIAVPTNLFYPIFGYQHMSIVHNKWAKKMPEFIVKFAGMLEELWMDLIKVVKGNILMKMPIVLIGNIVSNFVLRVVNGAEPLQLMKDYYNSFKDVREFTKNNREILKLQEKVATEKEEMLVNPSRVLKNSITKKESAIKRLRHTNDNNPVKELVDAGLYQAIVEDVEVSTIEGKTVWDKMGDKVLGKLPASVSGKAKVGVDILFFNQRTKWFKVNQEIMQLSDLVARDVQNRSAKAIEKKQASGRAALPAWWMNEKGWEKGRKLETKAEKAEFEERSKEVRMYALLENYVNYSRPSGRGEEYLNRMGILMFTKYAKRIQKVIMDQGTHYPLKTFLSVLLSNSALDLSTIQDASILSKDWHLDSHGAGNFYPLYSPLEHIMNFITPALIKDSTWDFLPI